VRWLAGVALVVLSGLPTRGAAQVFTSLEANAANATYDAYQSSAVYTLAPSVAFAGGPLRAGLDGAFSVFETGHSSGVLDLNAAGGAKLYGPLRWELGGDGTALWYRSNPAVLSGVVTPRLLFDRGPFFAWVGGAAGSTDNDSVSASDPGRAAQRQRGSFVSSVDGGLSYALPHITPTLTIATTRAGVAHYTDVGGTIQSELGPLSLNATAGRRTGALLGGFATWFNAEMRVTVTSNLSFVLSGGSYPVDLVRGAPGAHFIGVGLRYAQSFRVRPRPMGTVRYNNGSNDVLADPRTLRFSARPNAHVELMADFTDWQPVLMTEIRPGLYQARLPDAIRSGPHRVNIRVDNGDWEVPTELPPVTDDFGGTAGSLVVP
jgi:hypothetical protein